jgi:hypothetical protein
MDTNFKPIIKRKSSAGKSLLDHFKDFKNLSKPEPTARKKAINPEGRKLVLAKDLKGAKGAVRKLSR